MKKNLLILLFMTSFFSNMFAQKHEVGIVLSGGSALGYAHIGALHALEEYGIYPTIVSGASMGALIGAFYANGFSPKEIYDFVKLENFDKPSKIIAPMLRQNQLGLFSQKNILKILRKYIAHNSFDSLKMPLFVSVTNLSKNEVEFVHTGDSLHQYLLATSAIPTFFDAAKINGDTYVDGGVLNNFPAQAIRHECKYLIGIDVKADAGNNNMKRIKDILMHSLNLVIMQNSVEGRNLCDVLIEPQANKKYYDFDFADFDKIYQYGYDATKKYLEENPEIAKKLIMKK